MLSSIRCLVLTGMLTAALTSTALPQGETKELRVVTRMLPPLVLTDHRGQLSGFSIDIWNSISQRMQTRTKYHVTPNVGALLDYLRSGKADLGIAGVSATSARDKEFDFSQPILSAGLQIMVRARESGGIERPENLSGKRVATTGESTAAVFLRKVNAQVREFNLIKYAYYALLDGTVDAIVFDAPVLRSYAGDEGKGRVQLVGPLFQSEDHCIVFPQDSPLREQVNSVLSALREDGTYQTVYDKWFTKSPRREFHQD
jgi:glutamine transport system substrate-binding protein